MRSFKALPSFGYSLERDYNLSWFTPVAVIGGLVGIVFFSLINLASNGYELALIYTSDPQAVLSETIWFLSWSWDKHLQPNCSEQNIGVGAQVFTSNLGFTYSVQSVRSIDSKGTTDTTEVGSLPYLAKPLTDCEVEKVYFTLSKADQSVPGPTSASWWSWDDSSAQATAFCTVETRDGTHQVELRVNYKPQASVFDFVIQSNYSVSSSMWWATRLMNLYWYSSLTALSQQRTGISAPVAASPWTKGSVTYRPKGNVDDITRSDFFHVTSYFFLAANGTLINQDIILVPDPNMLLNNGSAYAYSEFLTQGLSFTRVMYSAVLLDLGSNSSQNVLLDETLLRWILLHPDDTFRNDPRNLLNATRQCGPGESPPECYLHYPLISMIAPPSIPFPTGPELTNYSVSHLMNTSYDAYRPLMGPLKAAGQTTISTQYACQVPQRKPFGSVLLPLLVADLVFLQACWKVLNMVALKWTGHRDKNRTAMWCVGCLEMHARPDRQPPGDVRMDNIQPKKAGSPFRRAGRGTNGSYLSLGSNESQDIAHYLEGDDFVRHEH